MTKIINLFGGPGCGKSTLQSDIYSFMKKEGLKVEMVREVAKKWAWKKDKITPVDQLNIIGQQIQDESELYGKVDYIVTDSPILLGAFYMWHNFGEEFMTDMVKNYMNFAENNGVEFKNFLLERQGIPYQQDGRYENKYQIESLDHELSAYLYENYIEYDIISCNPEDRINLIWSKI